MKAVFRLPNYNACWESKRGRWLVLLGLFAMCSSPTIGGSSAHAQFGGSIPANDRDAKPNPSRSTERAKVLQVILREGTQVGPVRGRFVLRGQRWIFLVENGNPNPADLSKMIDGGVARKVAEETGSVLGRSSSEDDLPSNTSGLRPSGNQSSFDDSSVGQAKKRTDRSKPPLRATAFDQMIVLENLMLGRIATAVEQDPDDDAWTITGRITEFQDENRLLLLTVHRATAIAGR